MNRKNFIIYESANLTQATILNNQKNEVRFICELMEADVKNRNGRIYPKDVMEDAINSPIVQERLRTLSFFGEAGHPQSLEVARQTTVDPRNLAFRIDRLWWEGNKLIGECVTCDTAIGRDIAGIIRQGTKISVSLRAQGKVENDPYRGAVVVQKPLNLLCWDIVVTPSFKGATLRSICEETRAAWFGTGESMMSLQESVSFYEEGRMFEITDDQVDKIVFDYTLGYGRKSKLHESYKYNKTDKIISLSEDGSKMVLDKDNHFASVVTEDYLRQALRNNSILTEENTRQERNGPLYDELAKLRQQVENNEISAEEATKRANKFQKKLKKGGK